jgi:hypothetical protein
MSVILRNAKVVLSTSTGDGLHDVSASTTRVQVERTWDSVDTTCVLDTAQRSLAGREEWSIGVNLLQSFSTHNGTESGLRLDQLLNTLSDLTVANRPFLVSVLTDRSRLQNVDNPQYSGLCLLENYSPVDGSVGDLLKVEPAFIGVSELLRGEGRADDAHGADTCAVQATEALRTIDTQDFLIEDAPILLTEVATLLIATDGVVSKSTVDEVAVVIDTENQPQIESGGLVLRLASDTIEVLLTEGSLVQEQAGTIPIVTSDTLEVHLVQEGQTILPSVQMETCKVTCTEAASIAFAVTVTDTLEVHMTDVAHVTAIMTTTDTLRAAATESILRLSFSVPAFIKQAQDPAGASPGFGAGLTTNTIVIPNVALGSQLTLVSGYGNRTITGVTDNLGNTWIQATHIVNVTGLEHLSVWYVKNAFGAASTTVTVQYSGAVTYSSSAVLEHSGCNARLEVNSLDASRTNEQQNPGVGSNAITTGNIDTQASTTLLIGAVMATAGTGNLVSGLTYTCRLVLFGGTCSATWNTNVEDRVLTTRQTVAATWTGSGDLTTDWISTIVAFRGQLLP